MLISVIVSIYNIETYLRRCLDSIVNQTYKELEIILVDDASEDNSMQICEEYANMDDRIKIIHSTQNLGVSYTRNKGLDVAKGEYIAFVDADDAIEKNFIEVMYESCQKYNSKLCAVNVNYCYEKNIRRPLKMNNMVANQREYCQLLITSVKGFTCNKLYHKSLVKNVRFDEDISVCEDLLFNIRVLKNVNNIVIVSQYLYNYFQKEYKIYNREYNDKKISELYAFDRIIEEISCYFPEALSLYKYEYLYMAIEQKNQYKHSKNRDIKIKKKIDNSVKMYYKEIMKSKEFDLKRKLYIVICDKGYTLVKLLKFIRNKVI